MVEEEYHLYENPSQMEEIMEDTGYTDVETFHKDLEDIAVDGTAQIQMDGRDISIHLHHPSAPTTSFTEASGLGLFLNGVADRSGILTFRLLAVALEQPSVSEPLQEFAETPTGQVAGYSLEVFTDASVLVGVRAGLRAPRPMVGSARGSDLVHLTTPEAKASIMSQQVLRGRAGIYVGPAANAEATGLGVTLRTGLPPWKSYSAVEIPPSVASAFRRPIPMGPFSAWQRATGQQFTAAGRIDLATGSFLRTGVNWNQATIYGLDAVMDTAALTGAATLNEANQ